MKMAVEITDANFDEVVLRSKKPVLVDFWAEWCGPCKAISPIVEEIAKDYKGKAIVGKLNVDANRGVAMKFGIRSIPAFFIFKNGIVVDKHVGAGHALRAIINQKLNAQI